MAVWKSFLKLFSSPFLVDESKHLTINSITNKGKRSYANVCKYSKKKDIKEGEINIY